MLSWRSRQHTSGAGQSPEQERIQRCGRYFFLSSGSIQVQQNNAKQSTPGGQQQAS